MRTGFVRNYAAFSGQNPAQETPKTQTFWAFPINDRKVVYAMKDVGCIDIEVLSAIREKYDELFPAERKTADYVLAHTDEAVQLNVSALAQASGVSDATIIRFAHHLGFSGYYQFRLALSRDLGKKQQDAADHEPVRDVLEPIFEHYTAVVEAVRRGMEPQRLLDCAGLISSAGCVHIAAVGNTSNIASYLQFRLERLGVRCTGSRMPEYFINHISLAREDDILLVISKSGSSRRIMDAMRLGIQKGLKIIVISSDPESPAARLADYVLDSGGGMSLDLEERRRGFSYLSEFVAVETLIDVIANEKQIRLDHAEYMEWILAENKL